MEMIPLIVFTTLSGLAAGTVTMSFLSRICFPDNTSCIDTEKAASASKQSALSNRPFVLMFLSLLLLGIGLIATLLHLGQPFRFINGLANPGSMISQESYWALSFMVLLLVGTIQAFLKQRVSLIVHGLAAVAGCGVMVVTALAYYFAIGIPLWNDAVTIPLFVAGNVVMGAACNLVLSNEGEKSRFSLSGISMLLLVYVVVVGAFGLHAGEGAGVLLGIATGVGVVVPFVWICYLLRKAQKDSFSLPLSQAITLTVLVLVGVVLVRAFFFMQGVHL